MMFSIKQKVSVRRNRISLGDPSMSLSDWIDHHCFIGEVLAIKGTVVEVCKIDSASLYGKGSDREVYRIDTHSDEYDISPLRITPSFQIEAKTIQMAF